MRIVLDLQGAQGESRFRGIGRYTLSLARAIIRQQGGHEVIVALSDLFPDAVEQIRSLLATDLPQAQVRVWQAPGPVRAHDPANDWRRAAAQRIREAFLASLEPDIVHVSDMFAGYGDDVVFSARTFDTSFLTVATLYDLIPLLNPDAYLAPDPRFRNFYLDAVAQAKRADGWLAISESSAREGREALRLDPESVVNVSAACDAIFQRTVVSSADEERLRASHGIVGRFVMYSGGSDERKNLRRLVDAYAQLRPDLRSTHQLVLVGQMLPEHVEDLHSVARAAGLASNALRFTGYIDDKDLLLLYNLCQLFVLPSTHEGFGLPALEAMSCGAAVIASNLTSVPEVIGWSEAMFDPLDVGSISAKITLALTDSAFRSELILRGEHQAQRFSWDESGRRSIVAFERLDDRRTLGRAQRRTSTVPVSSLVHEIRQLSGSPDDQDLMSAARAIAVNHPQASEQRLLVDVSELVRVDSGSGIQRVVRSMLTWLPAQLPARYQVEPIYAMVDRRGYRHARRSGRAGGGPTLEMTELVVEPRPGDIFLGLDLQHDVVVSQVAFYAELRRLGIPVHFVVYDLLPVLEPQWFPPDLEGRHQRWLRVVSAADGALCISRSVADELSSWVVANGSPRTRPLQIGWFHLGADIKHSEPTIGVPGDAEETLREFGARPTFLVVGWIDRRKGLSQTLDAFELLWGERLEANLVLVGKEGRETSTFVSRLRSHPSLGRRLFWLDGVSDEYLDELYRASTCLILPSEGEGFGLPLIEAAQHGTPILARDISVFREVAGEHAYYFSGLEASDLAEAVRRWLALWRDGRQPRPDDMRWLTWRQSAADVVAFLFGARPYVEAWPGSASDRSPK